MKKSLISRNIIWTLILVLCTGAFSLLFTNIYANFVTLNKKDTQAADLTISTAAELEAFARDVGKGNTYENKVVKLENDINMGNVDFLPIGYYVKSTFNGSIKEFRGTFDGAGFKIHNFKIVSGSLSINLDVIMNFDCAGFFAILGTKALVQNLELSDFTLQMPAATPTYNIATGGLAATCYGAKNTTANIKNCVVKNFTVIKSPGISDYDKYIAPVVGYKTGYISVHVSDCYVENFTVSLSGETFYTDYYIANVGPAFCTHQGASTVQNCIVNGVNISTAKSSATTKYDYAVVSSYSKVSNCYKTNSNITGLSISSVGGDSNVNYVYAVSSKTTWYCASDYNGGWPCLRVFMKEWRQVNFYVNPEGVAESCQSILIPYDADKVFSQSDSKTIVIYDQIVVAKSAMGYSNVGWERNSKVGYTALYEPILCTVKFLVTGGPANISPNKTNVSVRYGSTISYTIDKTTNIYTYVIHHLDNSTEEIVYQFPALTEYQIVDFKITQNQKITSDLIVSPQVDYKTYSGNYN